MLVQLKLIVFCLLILLPLPVFGQVNLPTLKTELTTDPTGLGYAPFVANGSNTSLAGIINQVQVTITITKAVIISDNILNATDITEVLILTPAERETFIFLMGRESVNGKTVGEIALFFPPPSTSRPAILALLSRNGSRSEQLFGENVSVSFQQIAEALALP